MINNNYYIINTFYKKYNIINYLFKIYNKSKINDNNILIRFIIKIIKIISKNNFINNLIINYQDEYNESFGFKILNSNLNKKEKILIFNLIKNYIDPLLINLHIINNENKYKFPLILYSTLLDEYEITYILLNNLIRSDKIKKRNFDLIDNKNIMKTSIIPYCNLLILRISIYIFKFFFNLIT